MLIPRLMQRPIDEALFKGKTIVVFGPRQVGKTTLVKSLLETRSETSAYFSCDLPEVQKLLREPNLEELRRFVAERQLIVLDEAQRVEGIGLALKILHEHFPKTQFIVTGSSSFELGKSVKEPLTGRKREFLLYPISLAELAKQHDYVALRELLPRLLRFGSYPEAITETDPAETVRALTDDYLFRDILELENFKSVALLRSLLEALALQLGSEVSTNELSRLVGISRQTVERYLDLLEQSFVVFRLRALSRNSRIEIAKGRKIYFYDLGIRNALIKNFNTLDLRTDAGALWENFCVIERAKHNHYAGRLVNAWFWRTYDQKEIDYIEESGGGFAGFEFKWGGGAARGAKAFTTLYPGSTIQVIEPRNVWDFAGVPVGQTHAPEVSGADKNQRPAGS
jgi:predicted AAA+ superfamily ATPase